MQICLATKNQNKVRELQQLLPDGFEFVINPDWPDTIEDGKTYEANARKKADAICAVTQMPTLAEDSGFEIEALNGTPGVYSARFDGDASYEVKSEHLLQMLRGRKSKAKFVAVFAFARPGEETLVFTGVWNGNVAKHPVGSNGFGYDPIFIPDGCKGATAAEMLPEVKNSLSHRALAMAEFAKFLKGE